MPGTSPNPQAKNLEYPGREGERYADTVPDTLDLVERGELALQGMCNTLDPDNDALMWFEVHFCHRPPMLRHRGGDWDCTPKFAEAIPQLRVMCGSDRGADLEAQMLDYLLRCISPADGLQYIIYDPQRPWHADQHSHVYAVEPEDVATIVGSATLMLALLARRALERTDRWDALLSRLARGIERVAIQKDDYAYYPDGGFGSAFSYPRSGWRKTDEPGDEHEGGEGSVVAYHGVQIRSLARWAAGSGDERALDFAGKLARFVMKPKFWGGFSHPPSGNGPEQGHCDSHFHARAIALRGLLEYGLVAHDAAACEFVRGSYEYMRSFGIPEIGYIPTFMGAGPTAGQVAGKAATNPLLMEGCFLGDLAALTIRLSEGGYGDYWEDADRVIRNHLVESQITDRGLLERIVAQAPEREPEMQAGRIPGQDYLGDDIIDRARGIFWSTLRADGVPGHWIMQCCTANAARGLYVAWEAITRCEDGHAQINLFLNRAAPWLDIQSHLPYEGKVVVRNKTATRISVRIPPWVNRRRLECFLNGRVISPTPVAHYIDLGDIRPRDVVELRFPMVEQVITRTAYTGTPEETVYTIRMKGNTVMGLAPQNESLNVYPFYRRESWQGTVAPLKTVTRYVAPVIPRW
ncbi:hypothetical protein HQ590_12035 [bacterium]|nr:hypothetical protein [bacterium]